MKKCVECKESKAITEYHKSGRLKDGLDSHCKPCRSVKAKKHWRNNREAYTQRQRDKHHANPLKNMYQQAKARSKKLGIPFDIEESDLTLPDTCPVLGIAIAVGDVKWGPNSPSLDKFIPALGYTKGNVSVISTRANFIKNDATPDEVMKVALWMEQQTKGK